MDQRIRGVIPFKNDFFMNDIFGYTTKGLPGLEIIGMGSRGRLIKEKFIYLARHHGSRMPMRRYVLCVEASSCLHAETRKWLEFPLLVLFWSLTGALSIKKLDDCFASGQVSVRGMITHFDLPQEFLDIQNSRGLKYISPPNINNSNHLSAESLMSAF